MFIVAVKVKDDAIPALRGQEIFLLKERAFMAPQLAVFDAIEEARSIDMDAFLDELNEATLASLMLAEEHVEEFRIFKLERVSQMAARKEVPENALERLKYYLSQKPSGNDADCVVGVSSPNGAVNVTVRDLREIARLAEETCQKKSTA